jgi:tetratricopeptide (TPR) repeat protein
VEAVKLRARLKQYYAYHGSSDQLVICVPKGGYVPEFRNQASSADQGRACADQVGELCDFGSFSLLRRTPAAIAAATRCFISARNLNPADARAHLGLANSLVTSLDIDVISPSDALCEIKASVLQGLRLNQGCADSHVFASLYLAITEGAGAQATREARRALELEPRGGMGQFWAAGLLSAQGSLEAGIELEREASQNAPYCTLFRVYLGRGLYYAARHQEALSVLNEVTTADPTFAVGHLWAALVHSELGQHDQAVHVGLHAAELSDTSATAGVAAYVLARAGRKQDAERILERLTKNPPYGYASPLQLGFIVEALHRREEAAMHLAQARRENAWGLIWQGVDPRVRRIQSGT